MKALTNKLWAKFKKEILAANSDRMHYREWDCTGNRHAGDCWCIKLTLELAAKRGYK